MGWRMEIATSYRYTGSIPAERIPEGLLNMVSSAYRYSAPVRTDRFLNVDTPETGFYNPFSMAYGPEGNLYLLNRAFGDSGGVGEVLKMVLNN